MLCQFAKLYSETIHVPTRINNRENLPVIFRSISLASSNEISSIIYSSHFLTSFNNYHMYRKKNQRKKKSSDLQRTKWILSYFLFFKKSLETRHILLIDVSIRSPVTKLKKRGKKNHCFERTMPGTILIYWQITIECPEILPHTTMFFRIHITCLW